VRCAAFLENATRFEILRFYYAFSVFSPYADVKASILAPEAQRLDVLFRMLHQNVVTQ
jgi:hypothetical protein